MNVVSTSPGYQSFIHCEKSQCRCDRRHALSSMYHLLILLFAPCNSYFRTLEILSRRHPPTYLQMLACIKRRSEIKGIPQAKLQIYPHDQESLLYALNFTHLSSSTLVPIMFGHTNITFPEWIKALLAVPFVLHSQPTGVFETVSTSVEQMAVVASRRYEEIMLDVENMIDEHSKYKKFVHFFDSCPKMSMEVVYIVARSPGSFQLRGSGGGIPGDCNKHL